MARAQRSPYNRGMNERPLPQRPKPDAKASMRRFLLEIGPLAVFFFTYVGWDYLFPPPAPRPAGTVGDNLMAATAVLMVAVVVSLALSYKWERRVPLMPLVTAVMVLVFGGLTLILRDEIFIKMKPTIVNALFAAALFAGLVFNRPFLQPLLGHTLQLQDRGWRILTWRWAIFFVFLAGLNEFVWRSFSTDLWVSFKAWGMFPITLIFAIAQVPLIQRYAVEEQPGA
ncbi:MAG: septation protein A [Rhodospirillaceae bacterium]|nr:septation protein A [Rhodospirillaceae bacterium]